MVAVFFVFAIAAVVAAKRRDWDAFSVLLFLAFCTAFAFVLRLLN